MLNKLQQLQKEHLIDLEDACVVVRDAKGKIRRKQAVDLVRMGALSGAAWVVCLVRWSVCYCSIRSSDWRQAWPSAPARARCRALSDYGIDDDFMRSTGQNIEAGSSALFILVRRGNFDKVQPELKPLGGKVLKTSLTNDQEERLRKALEGLSTSGVAT